MKVHEREQLLRVLGTRFEKNMHRHKVLAWADAEARLEATPAALASL